MSFTPDKHFPAQRAYENHFEKIYLFIDRSINRKRLTVRFPVKALSNLLTFVTRSKPFELGAFIRYRETDEHSAVRRHDQIRDSAVSAVPAY